MMQNVTADYSSFPAAWQKIGQEILVCSSMVVTCLKDIWCLKAGITPIIFQAFGTLDRNRHSTVFNIGLVILSGVQLADEK